MNFKQWTWRVNYIYRNKNGFGMGCTEKLLEMAILKRNFLYNRFLLLISFPHLKESKEKLQLSAIYNQMMLWSKGSESLFLLITEFLLKSFMLWFCRLPYIRNTSKNKTYKYELALFYKKFWQEIEIWIKFVITHNILCIQKFHNKD